MKPDNDGDKINISHVISTMFFWNLVRADEVLGVNKGGHTQSGATAHVPKKHILHGTQAGESERYVDHLSDT